MNVGGLLGVPQLGLDFGKDSIFYGVEHIVEHVVEQWNMNWTT